MCYAQLMPYGINILLIGRTWARRPQDPACANKAPVSGTAMSGCRLFLFAVHFAAAVEVQVYAYPAQCQSTLLPDLAYSSLAEAVGCCLMLGPGEGLHQPARPSH